MRNHDNEESATRALERSESRRVEGADEQQVTGVGVDIARVPSTQRTRYFEGSRWTFDIQEVPSTLG